jgi:hypothetical protein
MASLGSFAAAKREYEPDDRELDTFEFCGETFTVRGTIPGMLHLTIGASLSGKISGIDGAAAFYEVLRHALTAPAREVGGKTVPEDDSEWQRFYRLAIDRDVETEWITAIGYELLGAETGRPTERRSTSSTGPSPTGTSSNSSVSDTPASPDSAPAAAA